MMKALTLHQPWATLVAIGAKKIETRSWGTNYRGPLAIHAGKTGRYIDMRCKDYLLHEEPFISVLHEAMMRTGRMLPFPLGMVIAECLLVDCRQISSGDVGRLTDRERAFGDYTSGRYMWLLANVRPLRVPVETRGYQGLWEWERPASTGSASE